MGDDCDQITDVKAWNGSKSTDAKDMDNADLPKKFKDDPKLADMKTDPVNPRKNMLR